MQTFATDQQHDNEHIEHERKLPIYRRLFQC